MCGWLQLSALGEPEGASASSHTVDALLCLPPPLFMVSRRKRTGKKTVYKVVCTPSPHSQQSPWVQLVTKGSPSPWLGSHLPPTQDTPLSVSLLCSLPPSTQNREPPLRFCSLDCKLLRQCDPPFSPLSQSLRSSSLSPCMLW